MSWASAIYRHQLDNQVPPPRVETTKPDLAAPGDELFPIDLLMLERADFLEDSLMQEHLDLLAEGAQPNWYLKWLSDNLPRVGVFRLEQSAGSWYQQQHQKGEEALRSALRHRNCPVNFFGALARKTDHDLLQAMSLHPHVIEHVKALAQHEDFTMKNPNRVRSLYMAFAANPHGFHAASGEGYRMIADLILELDPINAQTAARFVPALGRWRKMEPARSALMREQLERIAAAPKLSRDTFEQVTRSLG